MANVTNNSLEALFKTGRALKKLEEGKYSCKVLGINFGALKATAEKGEQEFVELTLKLEDRTVTPRFFGEKGLYFLMQQLREQLSPNESIDYTDLLTKAMEQDSINVWVSYNQDYLNYTFVEPHAETTTDNVEIVL